MNDVLRDRRMIALFVGPALLVYTIIFLVPVFWSAGYTVVDGNPIKGFAWTGLSNYRDLLHDSGFWQSFRFTVKYAVVVTVGQVLAGFGLALLYQFYLRRTSALVRTLVFFPFVMPTAVIAQLFTKLFEISPQNGLVNSALTGLGMDAQDWLSMPSAAFWIIVVMDVWRSMGFFGILIYAGLVDIPDDLIEAARIDGASTLALVRRIIAPMLTPILASALIFSINSTIKTFDSIYALTGGGPGEATRPLTLDMFVTAFRYGEYGDASAIAMVLTIMSLAVTLVIFRAARRDVTA